MHYNIFGILQLFFLTILCQRLTLNNITIPKFFFPKR